MDKSYDRALTIAGFDGSGGAGIQADLKTFSAFGCYGTSVLTALPVQNTLGVQSIYKIPQKCIREQLHAILDDIGTDAIKIGVLQDSGTVKTIAKALQAFDRVPIVLDPVMMPKNGQALISDDAIDLMKRLLFPLTTILTPNLPEASALLQREICTQSEMEDAAIELLKMGPQAVIIKGGHLADDSCLDCLCIGPERRMHWFSSQRCHTQNTHGTGCTFAAAITAMLAKKYDLLQSVEQAKRYITEAIVAGSQFRLGKGHGPVNHFYKYQRLQVDEDLLASL